MPSWQSTQSSCEWTDFAKLFVGKINEITFPSTFRVVPGSRWQPRQSADLSVTAAGEASVKNRKATNNSIDENTGDPLERGASLRAKPAPNMRSNAPRPLDGRVLRRSRSRLRGPASGRTYITFLSFGNRRRRHPHGLQSARMAIVTGAI